MDIVARWTGRHGLALGEAMRLPREVFARQLGISPRTMADWARQPGTPLALKTQELLDVVLDRASDSVRKRFIELLQPSYWSGAPNMASSVDDGLLEGAAAYQGDVTSAVDLLNQLATADLSDQFDASRSGWFRTAAPGAIAGYMFGGNSSDGASASDVQRADSADQIRSVATHLMDLDFQLGGGVVRRMLLVYFQSEVAPLLRRTHPDGMRRDIFDAAAEVTQLLGWSAYDAGAHSAAQGYYTQGLRLAEEANDRRLGGYLMGDLSHQANYLGNYSEALQFARAAQSASNRWATATQATAALAMEARALASLGERRRCVEIIRKAERTFEQRAPGDDPSWMSYFTAEELAGEFLHCFTVLGMPREAREFSVVALGPATPARTRVFIEMISAQVAAMAGDLDEAIELARGALAHADAVASMRCRRYVSDFRRALVDSHGKDARVRSFLSDLRRDYPSLARAS
jgi:tetratricopeptide (TPR) repeat protein